MVGTFKEELGDLTNRVACKALGPEGGNDNWLRRGVRRLPGGDEVIESIEAVKDSARELVCNAASDTGDLDGYSSGAAKKGQCATQYRLGVTFTYPDGTVEEAIDPPTQRTPGPLGEAFLQSDNGSRLTIGWENAQGVINSRFYAGLGGAPEWEPAPIRVDGEEDACGSDGQPIPGGQGNPGYSGPMTYIDARGSEITVNVDIDLSSPIIDENGNLTIPFVYIDPDLEINPDLNVDLEPNIDFPGGKNCNGRYDPDGINAPDGEDEPDAPSDQRRIVGVIVTTERTTTNLIGTELTDGDAPSIFLPRVCSVVFAVNIGGEGCWIAPIDVQVLKQYVPVPGLIPAYQFDIKPKVGYTSTATPVYLDVPDRLVLS